MINANQRLYLVQARSDWQIFRLLDGQAECHRLHYLQMCTEKLGKSFALRDQQRAIIGHAAFVDFLKSIQTHRKTAEGMGFRRRQAFGSVINSLLPLARSIELLAPALAGDGPNPEYPWPRENPLHSPIEHRFQVWAEYRETNGRILGHLIDKVLLNFEAWY